MVIVSVWVLGRRAEIVLGAFVQPPKSNHP
jgi:hypothetical protein